jgi:cellulose synthase A
MFGIRSVKCLACGWLAVQPRSMDPSKDLAAYGYGSVAWKERMESWKQKQERMHQTRSDGGDGDDADLPLYVPETWR